MKAVSRFASMRPGEPYVMDSGPLLMLKLPVDSLALPLLVGIRDTDD